MLLHRLQTMGPCGACIHLRAAVCAHSGSAMRNYIYERKNAGSKLGQSQIEIRTKSSEFGHHHGPQCSCGDLIPIVDDPEEVSALASFAQRAPCRPYPCP
jgi:hypothetical protein